MKVNLPNEISKDDVNENDEKMVKFEFLTSASFLMSWVRMNAYFYYINVGISLYIHNKKKKK